MHNFVKKFLFLILFTFLTAFAAAQEWYVCLGSFHVEANALELKTKLEALQVSCKIVQSEASEPVLYRVFYVKPFKDAPSARNMRDELASGNAVSTLGLSGLWICKVEQASDTGEENIPVVETKLVAKTVPAIATESAGMVDKEANAEEPPEENILPEENTALEEESAGEDSTFEEGTDDENTAAVENVPVYEEEYVPVEAADDADEENKTAPDENKNAGVDETVAGENPMEDAAEESEGQPAEADDAFEENAVLEEESDGESETEASTAEESEESSSSESFSEAASASVAPASSSTAKASSSGKKKTSATTSSKKSSSKTAVSSAETDTGAETAPLEKAVTQEAAKPAMTIIKLNRELDAEEASVMNEENLVLSNKAPFSVFVGSYKDKPSALADGQRLSEKGIKNFVVSTYDNDTLLSFDLYAGAYTKEPAALEVQDKLEKLGVVSPSIVLYSDTADRITAFENLQAHSPVAFSEGNFHIPDSISASVAQLIKQLPVNKYYSIQSLCLADLQELNSVQSRDTNITDTVTEYKKQLQEYSFSSSARAALTGTFKDTLFNKEITMYAECGRSFLYDYVFDLYEGELESDQLNYTTIYSENTTFDCLYFRENETYRLIAKNEDASIYVNVTGTNFNFKEFKDYIESLSQSQGLVCYSGLRKSLLTLPDSEQGQERAFAGLELSRLPSSFVQNNLNSSWAAAMPGQWQSKLFLNQKDNYITVKCYDLSYKENAAQVYSQISEERRQTFNAGVNREVPVKNTTGWYFNEELSFTTDGYIFYINALNFTQQDLVNFAEQLKIW